VIEGHEDLMRDTRGTTIGGLRPGEPAIDTSLRIVENAGDTRLFDAPQPAFESATWAPLPAAVKRTIVVGLDDRVIPSERARQTASYLDPVDFVEVEADTIRLRTSATSRSCSTGAVVRCDDRHRRPWRAGWPSTGRGQPITHDRPT
jgi:hypothetical protein